MDLYSWVQGGLATNLDKTFFSSRLASSKVTTSGPRMNLTEQGLLKMRQPNEVSKGRVPLLDHWSPLPKRAATFPLDHKEAHWVLKKKRKASSLFMFSTYERNAESVYPLTHYTSGAVK